MRPIMVLTLVLLLITCKQPVPFEQVEEQIRQTEAAFNQMAKEEGLKAAFLHFAAEDAILIRGKSVVAGKSSMAVYFDRPNGLQDVVLTWAPDRIFIAQEGDMAYSFGKYQFSARDSSGQLISDEGIFRTLWKKQNDGQWRYLVD